MVDFFEALKHAVRSLTPDEQVTKIEQKIRDLEANREKAISARNAAADADFHSTGSTSAFDRAQRDLESINRDLDRLRAVLTGVITRKEAEEAKAARSTTEAHWDAAVEAAETRLKAAQKIHDLAVAYGKAYEELQEANGKLQEALRVAADRPTVPDQLMYETGLPFQAHNSLEPQLRIDLAKAGARWLFGQTWGLPAFLPPYASAVAHIKARRKEALEA